MRSVSTDSAHVPHEGEVSKTNVTLERTESEVVPHVGKSILAPASRLTPVTSLLAPMRVNKPQVTFDLMNTKLADGPNVSTALIIEILTFSKDFFIEMSFQLQIFPKQDEAKLFKHF